MLLNKFYLIIIV